MSLINIDNLSVGKIYSYFFTLCALIIPGFGYIYFFQPELFISIEIFKLLLLSLLYSLPIYIIGSSFQLTSARLKQDKGDLLVALFSASAFTLTSFFTSIILYLIFKSCPWFGFEFMVYMYGFQCFAVIIGIIISMIKNRRKNQ